MRSGNMIINKITYLVLLILLLILLPTAAFAKLTIMSPKQNMITDNATLIIIGYEDDENKAEINVSVKGIEDGEPTEITEVVDIYDKEFSVGVDLFLGMNNVTVDKNPFIVFYNDGTLTAPPDFKIINFHKVVLSGCTECHDTYEEGLPVLDKGKELCTGCHKQYMKIGYIRVKKKSGKIIRKKKEIIFKNLHKPVFEGKCLVCHEPHSSVYDKLLKKDPVYTLCEECHVEIFDALKLAEAPHQPQQRGECIRCHSPHASEEKYLFKKSLKFICFECHETFLTDEKGKMKKTIHKYSRAGACYECHDLHYKDLKDRFLFASIEETCTKCHKDMNLKKHSDAERSCRTCHRPHSSDEEALLITDSINLCKRCHSDILSGKVVHAAMQELCQNCHGKLHDMKSLDETKENCYSCHTDKENIKVTHGDFDIPKSKCSFCHSSHTSQGTFLLSKEQHPPFQEGECESCHKQSNGNMEPSEEGAKLCYQCHDPKEILKGNVLLKNTHTPVREGDCIDCHNPHAADYEKFLNSPVYELCFDCHDDILYKWKEEKHLSLHPPAEDGECLKCHDPHGSTFKYNLKEKVETLCFNCHDPFEDDIGEGANIHPPYEDRDCIACHDPHGTEYKFLIKSNQTKVCYDCHDNKTIDENNIPFINIHKPVRDGKCSACHDPHASKYETQLRLKGNSLCISCHKKLPNHHPLKYESRVDSIVIKKGFKKDGNNFACISCHSPHASSNKALFIVPKKTLCKKCHEIL